jgi:hypothetical protein
MGRSSGASTPIRTMPGAIRTTVTEILSPIKIFSPGFRDKTSINFARLRPAIPPDVVLQAKVRLQQTIITITLLTASCKHPPGLNPGIRQCCEELPSLWSPFFWVGADGAGAWHAEYRKNWQILPALTADWVWRGTMSLPYGTSIRKSGQENREVPREGVRSMSSGSVHWRIAGRSRRKPDLTPYFAVLLKIRLGAWNIGCQRIMISFLPVL